MSFSFRPSFSFAARFAAVACLANCLGCSSAPDARADEIRVATWNVHEGFGAEAIRTRPADFAAAGAELRPDVLVIEEVTSQAAAEAVRDAMGLKGYYVACSNFSPSDASDFTALEVAVISRFPFERVVEYDPTPDNGRAPGEPEELPLGAQAKRGAMRPLDYETLRGFLWVKIPALRLTVVGVHLKSSRGVNGAEDLANAEKREFITEAVAESVAQDLRLYPDYTCLVAGDFNVGHSDPKNGVDFSRDDLETASTTDGYDETHALLRDGLAGIRMRNLGQSIRESTFPGINSTPIDNIYAAGAEVDRFAPAALGSKTFGSDHLPVVSVWSTTPRPSSAVPQPPTRTAAKPPADAPPTTAEIVSPAEAAKHLNGRCTVEFTVRGANVQATSSPIGFLNSEADFRSDDNFTVVVFSDGLEKFRAAGIADFAAHFDGKRVRVTGQVTERRERLQIVVDNPRQIEIVP